MDETSVLRLPSLLPCSNWNNFTPFETALDVQPDRISNQSACFFLGISFRIAALKRGTHGEVPTIFVTFDDDGELVRLHMLNRNRRLASPSRFRRGLDFFYPRGRRAEHLPHPLPFAAPNSRLFRDN